MMVYQSLEPSAPLHTTPSVRKGDERIREKMFRQRILSYFHCLHERSNVKSELRTILVVSPVSKWAVIFIIYFLLQWLPLPLPKREKDTLFFLFHEDSECLVESIVREALASIGQNYSIWVGGVQSFIVRQGIGMNWKDSQLMKKRQRYVWNERTLTVCGGWIMTWTLTFSCILFILVLCSSIWQQQSVYSSDIQHHSCIHWLTHRSSKVSTFSPWGSAHRLELESGLHPHSE